jgi:hypothetical protein
MNRAETSVPEEFKKEAGRRRNTNNLSWRATYALRGQRSAAAFAAKWSGTLLKKSLALSDEA